MQTKEIIQRKRDGEELPAEVIKDLVRDFVLGEVKDYQMSSFLMSVYFRGLSATETAALTEAMWKSGITLPKKSEADYWIDKHSTGGVGDKPSLILVPLVTSVAQRVFGRGRVRIPMISGRGLGHSGGTLDKLEAVPGFSPRISLDRALALLEENDFFMMGQTEDLAPADRILYALRDVTGTVECIALIVSSIMSKKLAENLDGIVFDVKYGSGAFMKSFEDAKKLATALMGVSHSEHVDANALLTRMDEPLGYKAGHDLEVQESADFLRGKPVEKGLFDVTMALAAHMLHLASKKELTVEDAHNECVKELKTEGPWKQFLKMFEAQGGDWAAFEKKGLKDVIVGDWKASKSGYVAKVEPLALGLLLNELGGGRNLKTDPIDHAVGYEFVKKVGDAVQAGEPILRVHYRKPAQWKTVEDVLAKSVVVVETEPRVLPWITEVIA